MCGGCPPSAGTGFRGMQVRSVRSMKRTTRLAVGVTENTPEDVVASSEWTSQTFGAGTTSPAACRERRSLPGGPSGGGGVPPRPAGVVSVGSKRRHHPFRACLGTRRDVDGLVVGARWIAWSQRGRHDLMGIGVAGGVGVRVGELWTLSPSYEGSAFWALAAGCGLRHPRGCRPATQGVTVSAYRAARVQTSDRNGEGRDGPVVSRPSATDRGRPPLAGVALGWGSRFDFDFPLGPDHRAWPAATVVTIAAVAVLRCRTHGCLAVAVGVVCPLRSQRGRCPTAVNVHSRRLAENS